MDKLDLPYARILAIITCTISSGRDHTNLYFACSLLVEVSITWCLHFRFRSRFNYSSAYFMLFLCSLCNMVPEGCVYSELLVLYAEENVFRLFLSLRLFISSTSKWLACRLLFSAMKEPFLWCMLIVIYFWHKESM